VLPKHPLTQLAGAELSFQRQSNLVVVALLALPGGRQVLLSERTYRDGIRALIDPTQNEIETARHGDLWQIWGSERSLYLSSAVGLTTSWIDDVEEENSSARDEIREPRMPSNISKTTQPSSFQVQF
jgi:hypothetical protein